LTYTTGPPPSVLNTPQTRTLPEDAGCVPACHRRTPEVKSVDDPASPEKDQYIAYSLLLESDICVLTDSIPANVAACDAPEEPLDPPPTSVRGHGPTSDAGATATQDQGTPDPATTTTDGMEVDTDPAAGTDTVGG